MAVTFAIRNLHRRGVRTLLTGLAVALGATLLVALLTISGTADSRVVSQLGKGGPVAAIRVDDDYPAPNALASDDMLTANHHDTVSDRISPAAHSSQPDRVPIAYNLIK